MFWVVRAGPSVRGSTPVGSLAGALQFVDVFGFLPGERIGVLLAAEVSVVRALPIDRPEQIEVANEVGRFEGEEVAVVQRSLDLLFADRVGAECIDMSRRRLRGAMFLIVVALPALVALLGIGVWLKRRR